MLRKILKSSIGISRELASLIMLEHRAPLAVFVLPVLTAWARGLLHICWVKTSFQGEQRREKGAWVWDPCPGDSS